MTPSRSAVVRELPRDDCPTGPTIRKSGFQAMLERNATNAPRMERERQAAALPDSIRTGGHPTILEQKGGTSA